MTTGERIKELGFKRWYERTLIEGHAYLVTAFLGLILAFAGVELVGQHGGAARILFALATSATGTVIVAFSGYRYLRALMLAINLGDHATCAGCNTYASFNVLASSRAQANDAEDLGSLWMRVKCRKCGHEWRIE